MWCASDGPFGQNPDLPMKYIWVVQGSISIVIQLFLPKPDSINQSKNQRTKHPKNQ